MRSKDLAVFIRAREDARYRHHGVEGEGNKLLLAKPDPIIAQFRFCNVVRADDRTTQDIWKWVNDNGFATNEDLWFAIVMARLFNNKPTLDAIAKHVLPFRPAQIKRILHGRAAVGIKNFNAAYIVSTNGLAMDKVDYVLERVLSPVWAARKSFRPRRMTTGNKSSKFSANVYEPWSSYHAKMQSAQGLGSFMAAQIVADLKYFPPFYDANIGIPTAATEDWWTFAASGPGSRRGLNRVMNQPVDAPWREEGWRRTLTALHNELRPLIPASIGTRMSAQDVQNCLCEFDKFERFRLGEGRPKQLYTPYQEEK